MTLLVVHNLMGSDLSKLVTGGIIAVKMDNHIFLNPHITHQLIKLFLCRPEFQETSRKLPKLSQIHHGSSKPKPLIPPLDPSKWGPEIPEALTMLGFVRIFPCALLQQQVLTRQILAKLHCFTNLHFADEILLRKKWEFRGFNQQKWR